MVQFDGGFDDAGEGHIGCGVEIEDEAAGHFRIAGLTVRRMELDGGYLRRGDDRLEAVELGVGFAVAAHFDQRDGLRHAGHLVALKELLAADAIGRADDGAGAALDVVEHPRADFFVVAGEVKLGDAGFGPEHLVGVADRDAENAWGLAFGG